MIIVVLGLSWQQKSSIQILKKNKYKIIGIDGDINCECKNLVDIFLNIDLLKTKEIYHQLNIRKIKPKYIFSFNSEIALLPAAKLRSVYKMKGLSIKDTNFFFKQNKFEKIFKKK